MAKRKRAGISLTPAVLLLLAFLVFVAYGLGLIEPPLAKPAGTQADGTVSVHVIDVGQGNSALIIAPERTVLIDAGENDKGQVVKAYLDAHGVDKIDLAIGTHPHSDHIGGLDYVIDHVEVGAVMMPDMPDDLVPTTKTFTDLLDSIDRAGCKTLLAKPGDSYDLGGGAVLTILGPCFEPKSVNNLSIVARLDFGEASFLFSADAEKESEAAILKSGAYLESDVYGVGHHGSKTSSSKEYVAAINPKASFISLADGNSYGFPHEQTIKTLAPYGKIYRTDLCGDIVFTTDGETIQVTARGVSDTIDARG